MFPGNQNYLFNVGTCYNIWWAFLKVKFYWGKKKLKPFCLKFNSSCLCLLEWLKWYLVKEWKYVWHTGTMDNVKTSLWTFISKCTFKNCEIIWGRKKCLNQLSVIIWWLCGQVNITWWWTARTLKPNLLESESLLYHLHTGKCNVIS